MTLKIFHISEWDLEYHPQKAQQSNLSPIRQTFSLDQLKYNKMEILKILIGPVLNAYGRTNEDSQVIYDLFEPILKKENQI